MATIHEEIRLEARAWAYAAVWIADLLPDEVAGPVQSRA